MPKWKFSPTEDDILRQLVKENGTDDWVKIASLVRGRDARQCKERWCHYLAPELIKLPWGEADDALLEHKVAEYGRTWKRFELWFPGRTDIDIKNRYNLLMRRKLKRLRIRFDSRFQEFPLVQPSTTNELDPSAFETTFDYLTDAGDWEEFSLS
jgi:hypothetical protein